MIYTPSEMRKIIVNGGSVTWNGRVISRANISELPSEADWSIQVGVNLEAVEANLKSQQQALENELKRVSEAKANVKPSPAKKTGDALRAAETTVSIPEVAGESEAPIKATKK